MELVIKKLNKKYGSRKIKVFEGKKLFGEISIFWGWISIDTKNRGTGEINDPIYLENHKKLRKIAIENLWWLLHTDNLAEDVTEAEAWEEKVNRFDSGHCIAGNNVSLFFKGEKEIALNSINNK